MKHCAERQIECSFSACMEAHEFNPHNILTNSKHNCHHIFSHLLLLSLLIKLQCPHTCFHVDVTLKLGPYLFEMGQYIMYLSSTS